MSVGTPLSILSHRQNVCKLYKAALRNVQALACNDRPLFRYNAVLLRQRFEENKNVDLEEGKMLVNCGEKELFSKRYWNPIKFAKSPGGSAYNRHPVIPDWVLDYWHPLEKAQYPDYFACREQRKKEFIEMWERQYECNQKK